MERKKRLRLLQTSLLIFGVLVVFLTYSNYGKNKSNYTNTPQNKKDASNQLSNSKERSDIFYDIEYSGLDFSGNRYIIKSEEAYINKFNQELIQMKNVDANFYLKDNTFLNVKSNSGTYNNKSLDMVFEEDVKALYEGSELYAEKAEYSNSKSFLIITNKVKVVDSKGTIFADKLLFDIKNQTLNIASFKNSKINANVNLNEKRF